MPHNTAAITRYHCDFLFTHQCLKKGKGKGFPLPNSLTGNGSYRPTASWAQLIKSGAHPSLFAALSFPGLSLIRRKVHIYCWVDRETFLIVGWRSPVLSSQPSGDLLLHNRAYLTTRLPSRTKTKANSSNPNKTPRNAASDQGILFCKKQLFLLNI